jgi:hypothetical protein
MNTANTRRTEITIETRSVTIIRMRRGESNSAFCQNCRAEVPVFAQLAAALIFRAGQGQLATLLQNGRIHSTADGGDRSGNNGALCSRSLAEYFGKEIRCVED